MIFSIHFLVPLQAIPDGLSPRLDTGNTIIGVILFAAFVTVALVRVYQSGVYASLIVANGKLQGLKAYIKESLPLDKKSSGLLIFNYLLSGSAVLYLYAAYKGINGLDTLMIVLIIPMALFVWPLLSLLLTRILVGEKSVFIEPLIMKVIGTQLIGLIYFCLALVWMLNTNYSLVFINLMIGIFAVESVFRIIKSLVLVLSKGVPLYYIILYFCTLEILPLLIVYMAVSENFIDQ